MTAKEYLLEIQRIREDVKIYSEIVKTFHISYSSIHGIDYSGVKVQTSPKNQLEEAGWKMLEKHDRAIRALADKTCELNHRLAMINTMSRAIYSEILFLRYYDGLDMRQIADRLGKSIGTTANLHSEALNEFVQKYADTIKAAS